VIRPYPIDVTAGGKLLTQPAFTLDKVGDTNYTIKKNWRRGKAQEQRQEGWIKFVPNPADPNSYIFDGAQLLIKLAEQVRGDGTRAIIGASSTSIKRFDPGTFTWDVIGTGFNAAGLRWQIVVIDGTMVFNNAVDLPVYYDIGDATVTPLYELREVGIARVGRIAEYNGFCFIGDVTEIEGDQLNSFMFGYQNFVPSSDVAENANFSPLTGDAGKQFNVTTGAGAIVATLPPGSAQPPPTWWIWIQKIDAGAGTVTTLPLIGNQQITLANQNDLALIWSDGTNYAAKFFAGGVVPAPAPYGPPPVDIIQEHPMEVAWPTFADPTNWAPTFTVYMPAASTVLNLPFASKIFTAGQTLVAVRGGGVDGGVLGGDSNNPNGILVTAVNGNQITLAQTTDLALTYPLYVQVLRFADIGSIVGKQDLGAGERVTCMGALNGMMIFYHSQGAYTAKYTAAISAPFLFREKYQGTNVPKFGDCLISVNGDYHLYPAIGGRFYGFDGTTEPLVHQVCDGARDLFFTGINDATPCWAVDNPLTKQIWFCRPGLVFAYDYEFGTVSEIDTEIDAAVFCQRPNSTDKWFVLGIGSNAYTYGLVDGVTPIRTWLRDGVVAPAVISSGLMTIGDQFNEKTILSYTPILGSSVPDVALSVDILTTWNPGQAPVSVLGTPQALPDPLGNNYFTMMYQAIYLQDVLTVTDTRDVDCQLSSRLIEYDKVAAGGITRAGLS
jgi:hypothetical protein